MHPGSRAVHLEGASMLQGVHLGGASMLQQGGGCIHAAAGGAPMLQRVYPCCSRGCIWELHHAAGGTSGGVHPCCSREVHPGCTLPFVNRMTELLSIYYLLLLTTLKRYQPTDSSGKLLTTTSRNVTIIRYRMSLVTILLLDFVMIH